MRRSLFDEGNPLFNFFARGMERDHLFTAGFTALLSIVGLLSLLAGIAVWPTVVELSATESALSAAASSICMTGWIATAVCAIISLILAFAQKQAFSVGRIFLLNIILLWIVYFAVMIAQQGLINLVLQPSFTTSLLWIMASLFFGYVLAVVPAIIITVLVGVAYRILDMIFPA